MSCYFQSDMVFFDIIL
uniref:Uncharacterized protein n=1 Tax=Arundo donax TaxID=35708 RepID=A0A0A8Y8J7_ARUDO